MKKVIYVFTPLFLILSLLFSSFTPYIRMSEDISEKVFRLHILANSDVDYDQKLKLKVRDKVLNATENLFKNCSNLDEAKNTAKENLDLIIKTAENAIIENGYSYSVNAYVDKEYFNTRKYDSFSLPAGIYDCLKIEIGQGKGKNWWCVMFPAVCVSGCTSDFDEVLTDEEQRLIEEDKYIIRFKAVEIYERIKNRLQ